MSRVAFRTDFEPLALPREHIGVFFAGEWEFYRVLYVDSILPFRLDFGSLTAGNETNKLGLGDSSYIGQPEEDTLLELKVVPITDVEIQVYIPQSIPKHSATGNFTTTIKKGVVEHSRAVEITAVGNNLIYSVTDNRIARVKNLTIYNGAAADATVYLADSAGNRKSASYKVTAGQTLIISESEIDIEFDTDIYLTTDQQPLAVGITVEERATTGFENLNIIYGMQNRMPYFIVKNPTNYDYSSTIVEFYGYKYYLEKVEEEPDKWTFVPLGSYAGMVGRRA